MRAKLKRELPGKKLRIPNVWIHESDAGKTPGYVPSDQEERYSSCSGVSLSIPIPMDSSLS